MNLCRFFLVEVNLCRFFLVEVNLCRFFWVEVNLCRFFWVEVNLCRFNFSLYICIVVVDSIIKRGGITLISLILPHFVLVPSQNMDFQCQAYVVSFFVCVQWFEVIGEVVSFVNIGEIVDLHRLNFLFIIIFWINKRK